MKIAVMGAGSIGSYFGGLMAKAGLDMALVGRGEHIAVLKEKPLVVKSYQGDFSVKVKATSDPRDVGNVDLILFAVKSYDTEEAAHAMMPMVGEETVIISIQNGVDNEEKIAQIAGENKVLGGVTNTSDIIVEPGVIAHDIGGRIRFGELNGEMTERVRRIGDFFANAGLPIEPVDHVVKLLWQKLAINATANTLNAITALPQGRFLEVPLGRQLVMDTVKEIVEVGNKYGADLCEKDIDDLISNMEHYGECVSSTLQSLQRGKDVESEALNGVVVKKGEEVGVPTPINKTLYAILTCVGKAAVKKYR